MHFFSYILTAVLLVATHALPVTGESRPLLSTKQYFVTNTLCFLDSLVKPNQGKKTPDNWWSTEGKTKRADDILGWWFENVEKEDLPATGEGKSYR